MKILNIHDYPPLEGGGVEINVSRVSECMAKLGHDVTIATSRFTSETWTESFERAREDFFIFNKVKVYLVKDLNRLTELIDKHDIIHIHFTFSCRPAAMIALEECIKNKKRVVVSVHTSPTHIPFSFLSQMNTLQRSYYLSKIKDLFNNPDVYLIAPSYATISELRKFGIKRDIDIVYNGVSLNGGLSSSKHDNKTLDRKNGMVDITYIGEISILKGVNYLIDAIRMLHYDFNFKIKARLVGNGSDLNLIKSQIEYFGLKDNVLFTGYVENEEIKEYLKLTRLLVHPTLTETWGNVVAEALYLGVPVITTSVGGLIDLTNNGDFAYLVPPADSHILAETIYKAISLKEEFNILRKKALKGKTYISKKYTLENQVNRLLKLYNKMYRDRIS